jgi:hypothetical protein
VNPFKSKHRKTPAVAYTTDPLPAFLFEPSLKQLEVTAAREPRYVLYSPPQKGLIRLTKSLRLAGHLPGLTPISADVSHAMLEVIGLPGVESFVEAHSQADAPNQTQARRLLDQVKIELKDSRVRFLNASNGDKQHCQSSFTVTCPKDRPVTVRGVYAAVRLADLSAGANVETTHARITIFNVGPQVNARVEEGIIDYSGGHGSARLFAGWEINLRFISQTYTGELDATAGGPVRVLIPEAFATPFEASVTKGAAFVCRADINSQINHRERAGRLIYRFRQETPVIRFTSRNGPIVIDNVPARSEEEAANALG